MLPAYLPIAAITFNLGFAIYDGNFSALCGWGLALYLICMNETNKSRGKS
jgi:hypothetical protein